MSLSLFALVVTAVAAEPTLLDPADTELELIVLVDADSVDPGALRDAGVGIIDPTFLVRDGWIDFVDPTPVREVLVAADVADEWTTARQLTARELCGMSGVPITLEGAQLIGLDPAPVGDWPPVPVSMVTDPVGANPTPYPYPVPIARSGADGMGPSLFLLGDRTLVEGWVVYLNDRDELVGMVAQPQYAGSRTDDAVDQPVLMSCLR